MHHASCMQHSMPQPCAIWIRSSEAGLRCRVHLCDWSIDTCHYRGQDLVPYSISVIEASMQTVYALYWPPIYHIHHYKYAATRDMVKCFMTEIKLGSCSLVPRPLPRFQCYTQKTLKTWEWPGDEAKVHVHVHNTSQSVIKVLFKRIPS